MNREWLNQYLRDATNLRDHAYTLPKRAAVHGGKQKYTRKAGFCQTAVYCYIAWLCNQSKQVDSANCQPLLHRVPSEMLPVRWKMKFCDIECKRRVNPCLDECKRRVTMLSIVHTSYAMIFIVPSFLFFVTSRAAFEQVVLIEQPDMLLVGESGVIPDNVFQTPLPA